ncbi:cofactor-independent phosphoglycerate mutase [Planctomicrobium piriforme]|uniref:2,3-bisphosphoglycerate-independent phosphoglycerate mutase n=1 Tax=Planctomicrobium piriforme TaxID=1576369 RepID=A0A1I3GUH2_9PLAN|nr:cofactor-independent phosphoglycerate mutase [Planctomicrobium piriforme]SFI26979.1 2,3-bisphosphoglycerate-independent phosphoglycerate mutase [Planctomicrobium piriforme]
MKYVLVIPDGCADESQASLGNKTPLQAARVPHMDEVARAGSVGLTDNVPVSMPSGSDVGTMSLFGYDPKVYHTGRAPLEAAAQGIQLGPDDWAIRCNLVTIENERMKSFTAGQVPNDIGRDLITLLQQQHCGDEHWKFYAGVSYRNLLLYRPRGGQAPFAADTFTTPPHDITDQLIEGYLPTGSGSAELRQLMDDSRALFADCEPNRIRLGRGELPVTQTWLWGQGRTPSLMPFQERFGVRGAVITAVDLLRGIGRLLGWDVIEVAGATGYLDTDYAAKGRAAIETLKGGADFVVVHVEATDEASHEGHPDAKVTALEEIDRHIVGPVHAYLKSQGDYRLLVCPDHPTFCRTKTHSHGFVPFAMCGQGISHNGAATYDEVAAKATGDVLPAGHDLMPRFIQG